MSKQEGQRPQLSFLEEFRQRSDEFLYVYYINVEKFFERVRQFCLGELRLLNLYIETLGGIEVFIVILYAFLNALKRAQSFEDLREARETREQERRRRQRERRGLIYKLVYAKDYREFETQLKGYLRFRNRKKERLIYSIGFSFKLCRKFSVFS